MKPFTRRLLAIGLLIVPCPFVCASATDKVRIGGNVIAEAGTEVKNAVAVVGNVTVYGKVILWALLGVVVLEYPGAICQRWAQPILQSKDF